MRFYSPVGNDPHEGDRGIESVGNPGIDEGHRDRDRVLRDGGGSTVADGNYSVAFTIYDAEIGGAVHWAETTMVTTTDGLFTVLLGTLRPLADSVFHDSSRFLGIQVEADPEMSPRQRLGSSGYSFVSSQWTSSGDDVFRSGGRVGLGESEPLSILHLRGMDLSLPSTDALTNEDILVEDDDAVLGLYSGTGGTYGSAIALGEIDAGTYTNKWSLYRTKTLAGSLLGFSYGADSNYGLNPTHMVLEGTTGQVGIGETNPLSMLHVRRLDMSLPGSPGLNNDDIVIEDDDAVLGIYSGTGGTYGSAIVLGEVDAGVYTNKWGIVRTRTSAGSKLFFTYREDTSYALNPAALTLDGPNLRTGVGTVQPANRLDVEGAAAIGASYSGSNTAPANGLLVQGKVGLGTTSVYSDANTSVTSTGSIGFTNGATPMLYMYESGTGNVGRPIIAHSPDFPDYGLKYSDATDDMIFQSSGSARMTVSVSAGADVLDVNGNVTVGTGSTGCVKDADGTIIAGTCSSDERLKTEIEPFPAVLNQLVQLQPVHFRWRADEYPERNFSTKQSYGLIAQAVAKVMPDLVAEDEEGYLAVRYSKLPLLLLEALKEQQEQIAQLQAEIESLRAEVTSRAEK